MANTLLGAGRCLLHRLPPLSSLTARWRGAQVSWVSSCEACGRQRLQQRGVSCSAATLTAEEAGTEKKKPAKRVKDGANGYEAQQIQARLSLLGREKEDDVLEGLEPVRKRPGMYIGSTGQRGLHHLVYELLDNCMDEVQAGHATDVKVEIDTATGWVTVGDNGRGIPTDVHPATGVSAVETVLTVLHSGGKFGGEGSGYKVSGGLHGVGVSVVNALSESLHVKVWRQGKVFSQSFSRGAAVERLKEEKAAKEDSKRTGTEVSFLFDKTIMSPGVSFDVGTIRTRLKEVAYLNKEATIWLHTPATAKGKWEELHYKGGLAEYVTHLASKNEAIHEPFLLSKEVDGVYVEAALVWCNDLYSENVVSFVNNVKTVDGGTHLEGLRSAVTKTVNQQARKSEALKAADPNLSGDHAREGLCAVLSVKVAQPEFEGQTKTRLGNPEVRKVVEGVINSGLSEALELHPSASSAIMAKGLQALRASQAAKKARELVRRKTLLTKSTLPGKLADCTTADRSLSEIFIVEGDSAGGSAKQARDRVYQAVLPLRGKILNVERSDDAALYKNSEIASLVVALGLGVKNSNLDGLRYNKVILLTDADVDGAHIRTLLLTFLYRYAPALFEEGHVYVGVPPLYKLEVGRKSTYLYDEEELEAATQGLSQGAFHIQRFKGLGEMMPAQLWDTTLDPATRALRRLRVTDAQAASDLLELLMGSKVQPRRELIQTQGGQFATGGGLDI